MKVIQFPGGSAKAPALARLQGGPTHRLAIGSVPFTCAECGDSHRLDFHGIVFRTVDFYCQRCGSFYKLTNPAFAKSNK